MKQYIRATVVALFLGFVVAASGVAEDAGTTAAPRYEVWALDQSTNIIHIIEPAYSGGSVEFRVTDRIVFDGSVVRPHMIDFTSDYRYAFIANTVSGNVAVIRTADREVIDVIRTGPGSHMAAVAPGDRVVHVDVIADGTVVEINLDLANEDFTIGRTLEVNRESAVQAVAGRFAQNDGGQPITRPICHDYTADGRYAYITLGLGLGEGGLVILDTESFEIIRAYPPDEVRVNCGTILSPDGSKMYVNGGSLDVGHWYVFDTATHELTHSDPRNSFGYDAHGVALTPDGGELWMVNRASSNAIVVDPATDAVIDFVPFVGESPDILAISPEGRFAFITLRGPEPLSGPHAIRGSSPGVAVVDVAARKLVTVLLPEPDLTTSDFHGIGIRPLDE